LRDDPPFLICHGGQDPLVPPNQSELLDRALRDAGVSVTFRTVMAVVTAGAIRRWIGWWGNSSIAISADLDRRWVGLLWRGV